MENRSRHGGGQGIGGAIALRLAHDGADIAITDLGFLSGGAGFELHDRSGAG